jgi:hypothetical protein
MPELPAAEKATHAEVKYVRPSEHIGQACGDCRHVIEATTGTRCQSVKSPIWLNGWCVRWEKQK